ncbi:unnamed protein product [Urochloa humidicola]
MASKLMRRRVGRAGTRAIRRAPVRSTRSRREKSGPTLRPRGQRKRSPWSGKDWETTVESALARQRKQFDAALAFQKTYYEGKLCEENELNDKIGGCKDGITEADIIMKLLIQKYDFFKDNNE